MVNYEKLSGWKWCPGTFQLFSLFILHSRKIKFVLNFLKQKQIVVVNKFNGFFQESIRWCFFENNLKFPLSRQSADVMIIHVSMLSHAQLRETIIKWKTIDFTQANREEKSSFSRSSWISNSSKLPSQEEGKRDEKYRFNTREIALIGSSNLKHWKWNADKQSSRPQLLHVSFFFN